jgi:hypothetical protein
MKLSLEAPRRSAISECVYGPAEMPRLDPRPMPSLRLACPTPLDGTAQRYRMPLWRSFEQPEND